jgi:hypothetical protein
MFRRFKQGVLQDLGIREKSVDPEFDARLAAFDSMDPMLSKVCVRVPPGRSVPMAPSTDTSRHFDFFAGPTGDG